MGDAAGGHQAGEFLYLPGDSPVHRLPAHVKIVAAIATVLVVVLTPVQPAWPFWCYAAIVLTTMAVASLSWRRVLPRLAIELPFVVFAVVLPFVATGPRVAVGPFWLSEAGLIAAWGTVAKATLGVLVSIVLAATTSARDMVAGLQRLRLPDVLVMILASMLRYVHVVRGELDRMTRARAARGYTATGIRSWPTLAAGTGTLFVRAYERGERVHLAMLSRGYDGRLPDLAPSVAPSVGQWSRAAVPPVAALVVALVAWRLQ